MGVRRGEMGSGDEVRDGMRRDGIMGEEGWDKVNEG